jgi:hypothetical protein
MEQIGGVLMEQVKVWVGRRGTRDGSDNSRYDWITFDGELLGRWQKVDDERGNRGTSYTIYTSSEGTVVLYRVKWSRWADESDYATLIEYSSIDHMAKDWRYVLENAGVIPRRTLSLAEWRKQQTHDEDQD